jgi:hypothetical protein
MRRVLIAAASTVVLSSLAFAATRTRSEWTAAMRGKDGRKLSGAAAAKPTADGLGTDVTLTLDGDTPGATRPWHIHAGSCAKGGPVVGAARAYAPMSIDTKGRASAKATLAVVLADTATYYVNVHDAAAAMGIIVACGDLARK